MRNLKSTDVFAFARIVKAAGVRNEVKYIANKIQSGEKLKAEDIGLELILAVIEGCAGKETEELIFSFLADIMEVVSDELKDMDPLDLFELLKEFSNYFTTEKAQAFFKSVSTVMR